MSEEKIIKLLKSSHKDDKLIGVTLAVKILGRDWCKEHLNNKKYKSNEMILLKYDDFDIFLGCTFIEFYAEDEQFKKGVRPIEDRHWNSGDLTIINNKTNDTNKELSESTCKA